jgi:CRISPR-associated protein Cas1
MPTLYVTEPGSRVEKDYQRINVTKDDEVIFSMPITMITHVVLVSSAGITTPALLSLLDAGRNVSLISSIGNLRGRLVSPQANNIQLRHKQYARSENDEFVLKVCRNIIKGKIKNCCTLSRRMLRQRRHLMDAKLQSQGNEIIQNLVQLNRKVMNAPSIDSVRGLEGSAAREYFSLLRKCLRSEFYFENRSRRPPADPANSLLSLAYGLLSNSIFTACEVVGLDPYDGFLHANKYGRPALVLDLMEEFRSVIADSVVLRTINNRMLQPDDFTTEEGENGRKCILKKPALRAFLHQYSRRINETVYLPEIGKSLNYQKIFEVQVRRFRKVLEGELDEYAPFQAK